MHVKTWVSHVCLQADQCLLVLTIVDPFSKIFEMYPTSIKKLYVVDGGLTFNSPYSLVLRPQREVDLILSFDFSARPSDTALPFKVRSIN